MPPNLPIDLAALAEHLAPRLAAHLRADAERLLDLRELADRLKLSERGVRGLVKRHELPEGFLIGGVRRWAWAAVQTHLEAAAGKKTRRVGRGKYERSQIA